MSVSGSHDLCWRYFGLGALAGVALTLILQALL
jgi:hypothetical protein